MDWLHGVVDDDVAPGNWRGPPGDTIDRMADSHAAIHGGSADAPPAAAAADVAAAATAADVASPAAAPAAAAAAAATDVAPPAAAAAAAAAAATAEVVPLSPAAAPAAAAAAAAAAVATPAAAAAATAADGAPLAAAAAKAAAPAPSGPSAADPIPPRPALMLGDRPIGGNDSDQPPRVIPARPKPVGYKTKWCEFYWRSHGCRWDADCRHCHSIAEFRGDPADPWYQWYKGQWTAAEQRWNARDAHASDRPPLNRADPVPTQAVDRRQVIDVGVQTDDLGPLMLQVSCQTDPPTLIDADAQTDKVKTGVNKLS